MVKSEEVDRISALSDVLLALILSFLSMKDVVKTSILCRRWKNIWTRVPILDFSGFDFPRPLLPSFKAFVYKALLLNDALLLRRFSMDHLNGIEDFHVNSWIWSAMNRNIVNISLGRLGTSVFKQMRLVGAVFSSETLQVLKLNGRFILPSVVPSLQHLPKLELLHLVYVTCEQNDALPVLLSVCPRLEQLLLHHCFGPNEVHIQSSSLRKLEIISTIIEKKVVLNAPKLENISLTGDMSIEIKVVQPLTCLVEAIFNGPWEGHGHGIIDLLHHISKLKTLKLTQLLVMHSLEYGGAKLPVFVNLSWLEVAYGSAPFVLQMLENAPSLTTLRLRNLDCMESMDERRRLVDYLLTLPESTPKCFSSSLRYVQMNGFCGYGSHLKLAEYILTYAEVLKVIKIYTANEDWDKEMNGLMQLFSVNRASTHCEFTIGIP